MCNVIAWICFCDGEERPKVVGDAVIIGGTRLLNTVLIRWSKLAQIKIYCILFVVAEVGRVCAL